MLKEIERKWKWTSLIVNHVNMSRHHMLAYFITHLMSEFYREIFGWRY